MSSVWTVLMLVLLAQSPADIFKAASADMDASRWADAAAKFEQVLKDDPRHIPSQFNLAVCFMRLGNREGAERMYRTILQEDGTVYEARINLGILLYQSDNMPASQEQFESASTLRPDDPMPVLYRARIFEKRGDAGKAAENYERAIQLNSSDPDSRLAAGLFYLQTQNPEKAFTHLSDALRLGGSSAQLFIALSEAEHLRKNESESRAYLEKALEADASNKNIRRQLGISYSAAGQYDKAIEILKQSLPEGRPELAIAYFDNRNFADALPLLEELTTAAPKNVDFLYMLGKSQMELKQYPKAAATLLRVIQNDPAYVEAYSTLGSTYYLHEDWARAIPALERFIQFKPKQAFAYFVVATCYDKLGKLPQAVLNYNRFLELDDGSNDARSFQTRQRVKTLERRLKK